MVVMVRFVAENKQHDGDKYRNHQTMMIYIDILVPQESGATKAGEKES